MNIAVKWRDGNKWKLFNLEEINHMPRDHAIRLFSGNIQVVAKQDETYIVNRQSLKDDYTAKNQKCLLFSELQPNSGTLAEVGMV